LPEAFDTISIPRPLEGSAPNESGVPKKCWTHSISIPLDPSVIFPALPAEPVQRQTPVGVGASQCKVQIAICLPESFDEETRG
jgi:hypothetical protein